MASTNQTRTRNRVRTHEGARTRVVHNPVERLQNLINTAMLWEDTFYIDGETHASMLKQAVHDAVRAAPLQTNAAIVEARTQMNIRHASLQAAVYAVQAGTVNARQLIFDVIQRADEMAEVIAMAGGKKGMTHAIRKGVRDAMSKFDAYQAAKYKGEGRSFTLRDVVFLTHPDPNEVEWVQPLINGDLQPADTWEVGLSTGRDKREVFTRLLRENKLGAMALLRNLRNMAESGVDRQLINEALSKANWSRVLPFRFMTAAIMVPEFAFELDRAFQKAVEGSVYLRGRTAVMVDTSASMAAPISAKTVVMRHWAGAVLGAAVHGDHVDLFEWASKTRKVANFRSLSTATTLQTGGVGHGTDLYQAMEFVQRSGRYDRFIVLSDVQFHEGSRPGWSHGSTTVPILKDGQRGYTIDLAAYGRPGLVHGDWLHFSGFSQQVLRYIAQAEAGA